MPRHLRSRSAVAALSAVLVLGVACTNAEGPVCELSDYATDIQGDLDSIAGMDPELVAQAGTPENAAALAAIDSLAATQEAAQEALDAASNDEVGPVVRGAFQLILETTGAVVGNLSSAIESGDAAAVESALTGVQAVSDAVGAFDGIVEGLGIDCAAASPSASVAASASVAPSVAPTPVVTATPEPTAAPTATPEPTETEEPDETPEATQTAAPTAVPTAVPTAPAPTPTASPTPSPTPSESASASGSGSPEPSPSPSAEPDDEQGGLLPWILILGLLGTGAAAVVIWYTNRNEPPPDEGMTGTDDPGSMDSPPPAGPPPAAPPPTSPPPST